MLCCHLYMNINEKGLILAQEKVPCALILKTTTWKLNPINLTASFCLHNVLCTGK